MSAPQVGIITAFDGAMGEIGEIAVHSWGEYAAHRGHKFAQLEVKRCDHGRRHPSWAKLAYILVACQEAMRATNGPAFCVWVDADSAVFNPVLRIEEIARESNKPILIARDAYGPCCGHIIVRPCHESMAILSAWWVLGESDQWRRYHAGPKQEQDALKVMLEFFPEVRKQVHVFEREWVCQEGDPEMHHLAIHASGPDMGHRLERLRRWAWTG